MIGLRSVSLIFLLVAFAAADCPSGTIFESTFNKCYKFFNTPQTFLAAEQTCNSIGGHLVAIQNSYENTYVSGIVREAAARTPNYWIGANLLLASSWSWTANASFTYANWANGQPNSSNSCGLIRDLDSKWITGACNTPLPFVCAVDPSAPLPGTCSTSCPNDAVCSPGYTLFPGNCMCYKYFSDYKSYSAANASCAQNGGMLASSTSADVNDFLTTFPQVDCQGGSCPYIGLQCTSSSLSSCQWADGSSLGSYTNFHRANPENSAYAMVTRMHQNQYGDIGQWEPTYGDNRAYICQKASTRTSLLLDSRSRIEKNEEERGGRMDRGIKKGMTISVDL